MRYTHRLKMLLQSRFTLPSWWGRMKVGGVAISILLLSFSFFITPAFATLSVVVSSEVVPSQGVLPNSPKTALLKLQFTAGADGESLTSIIASVVDADGVNAGDIHSLSIYRDGDDLVSPSSRNGVFDSGDTWVAGSTNSLYLNATGLTESPWFGSGPDLIWCYFIVVETSGTIAHGDAFQGRLDSIFSSAGSSYSSPPTPSNLIRCECEVADIYYTESKPELLYPPLELVATDTYLTYWQPNYIPYSIAQEMTEPKENSLSDTDIHPYSLSEARRYSFIDGSADNIDIKAAASNLLKFERRRKLMGMNVNTPVLGIKVAGKNQFYDLTYNDTEYFDTMVIVFRDTSIVGNFDNPQVLNVAVYKDTNGNHVFNNEIDQEVLSTSGWSGDVLTLTFSAPSSNPNAAIPRLFDAALDDGTRNDTDGVDFFVVIWGNTTLQYGADFTVRVSDMAFQGYNAGLGADPPADYPFWYETGEIKAIFELSDYTGTRVDPSTTNSTTTFPVIGINVNRGAAPAAMSSFKFYLKKTDFLGGLTNFDPTQHLAVPGVTVRNRSGALVPTTLSAWNGVSISDWWWTTVTFDSPGTTTIPSDDIGVDSGPEYFINLTTSDTFGYNKKIIAEIRDGEFVFTSPSRFSAVGTALTTNANVDHGSNSRSYPDITIAPSALTNNPILGNPSVVFSQLETKIKINNTNPTAIIGVDLAANTSGAIPATPVELKSMVVQIVDVDGGFLPSHLAAMTADSTGGIGLYDSAHNPITLAFPPTRSNIEDFGAEGYYRYLLVLQTPLVLPVSGTSKIFVTLKTSNAMLSTDVINLRIWGSEIKPCSSYGLGFRPTDANVIGKETSDKVASVFNSNTLRLTPALGGSPPLDYSQNWYLVITGGVALGQVYRVVSISDTDVTVVGVDGTAPGLSLNSGTVTAVRFFRVESTSYQNFSAPVACSGSYSLKITEPSSISPSERPNSITKQYQIKYDADAIDGTPFVLYRVKDSDYPDTKVVIPGSPPVGLDQTYTWDTNSVPPGTYYIYGELGSGVGTDTAFSLGTVTIGNSLPRAGLLTIPSPINIGDTVSVSLHDITDADSNNLTVTFYSTDAAGADTRWIPGSFPVTAPYPKSVTTSWNTTYDPVMPAGSRRLYARVSDVANPYVLIGPTTFVMQVFGAPTGSAVNQVISGQGILPNSPRTAIFGLNLTRGASNDPLDSVTVTFTNVYGFDTDLAEVALYRDSGGAGNEVFDSSDVLLGSVSSAVDTGLTYTIPGGGGSLPANDTEGNAGIDYFIVVRTSNTINHYDAFSATNVLINGGAILGVYNVISGTIRCECKVVDVFYTQSYHFDLFTPPLILNPWNYYWTPNYLSYSIRTEMTEPNENDPAGDPRAWYLTDTGNYRYSYTTGGPFTSSEYVDFTRAYSNLLKFERKRQLLQMQVPTAILGIKVAGKNQYQSTISGTYDNDYLNRLVIDFTDTDSANFNARDMLYPLNVSDEIQSGVALYRDNNHNGILDEGDQPVPLYNNVSYAQWSPNGNRVTFDFSAEVSALSRIPQTYDAEGGGDSDLSWNITHSHDRTGTDFLVVIRARPQTTQDLTKIKYGADFTAKVTTLTFTGGTGLSSPTRGQWYSTREIKAVLELSDLTGSRVDPNSTFPLIGINVVDAPDLYEKIYNITLQLKKEVGFDPNIDISNVLIYRGAAIQPGISKSNWVLVGYPPPPANPTEWWWETTISSASGLDVPDTDTGLDQGDDYYVVLQTSQNFGYLDKITGRILDGGIVFSGNTTSAVGTGLTTNALLTPVSNTRVHWDPFASPETPLPGNVAVKFHDLITTPFLEAGSYPQGILGLELSSNTVSDTQPVLKSLVVQLINRTTENGNLSINDLAAMTTDSNTSGLGVWKDLNDNGVFDAGGDEALTMAAPPTQYVGTGAENYQRFIIVLNEAQSIGTSFSPSGHSDYFITVKTKNTVSGDQFAMRLWGSEMKPPASYSLGFRTAKQSTFPDDNVTTTEAVPYGVAAQTTTPTSTLTLGQSLGGSQSDYSQNWYLVVTGAADTAKGAVRKIFSVNAGLNIITCEDLSGLGSVSQVRVFKLDSTSYQNHSVGVAFERASSVTLFASSTTTTIVLTWVDATIGGGARTFDIERRVKGTSDWTNIDTGLSSASTMIGLNTYQYVDVSPGTVTNEYRVTVKQAGVPNAISNTVSAKVSAYFPYRPTNLQYTVGFGVVEISWDWQNGNNINESGFIIERKGKNESAANWSSIGSSQSPLEVSGRYTDRSITDTMLQIEDTYDYRVRAYKGMGIWTAYSDYSDPIEVQVLPSSVIPNSGGGGGGAVGPLALGISALLGWWKRRRQRRR